MDAIIVSDIHLGSSLCQARHFAQFLDRLHSGDIATSELILNGDVFDSWDFRRLKKSHWKVLSLLRRLSDKIHITWINGNHDGPADIVSHLLGLDVADRYVFQSGDKQILAIHGHQFDEFIVNRPILTWIGDISFLLLQRLDPSFALARQAKRASKTFLRCSELIQERATAFARRMGCDVVCCGHTHYEVERTGDVSYYNSGCWTELPCSYLSVLDGTLAVNHFEAFGVETYEPQETAQTLEANRS